MTNDEIIAVVQASIQGKTIEVRARESTDYWSLCREPIWDFGRFDYRIKPEPKRVPLGPEDVPFGIVFSHRNSEGPGWAAPVMVDREGVYFARRNGTALVEWSELEMDYDFSRDAGKTWHPCWKETP